MSTETREAEATLLPKVYQPDEAEGRWYQQWREGSLSLAQIETRAWTLRAM